MALIEIEFLRGTFEGLVSLVLGTSPAIPTPTLQPLGADRLIRQLAWGAGATIVPGFPGYAPRPGSLLLRAPLRVWHVSIAELRVNGSTAGTAVDADAWILITPTAAAVDVNMVAFAARGAHASVLAVPVSIGNLPLPAPEGVVAAALVAGVRVVTLRMATTHADDLLRPPVDRLPAVIDPPDAVGTANNWLIHVPAAYFTEWVLSELGKELDPPPAGTTIETGPSAHWTQFRENLIAGPFHWGVIASAELEKEDACPALFDDVDVSITVSVNAAVTINDAENRLDIRLTVATDASDWDSFRCWLGSGGLASMALGSVNPFIGFAAAVVSLVYISEQVRHETGDAARFQIDDFTEVRRTTSSVTYAGSMPVQPIPFSSEISMALGSHGLDVRGTMAAVRPDHAFSFIPNGPALTGTWRQEVNCSTRSYDSTFAPEQVVITDNLMLLGAPLRSLPVTVFLTSIGEPAAKCGVFLPNARPGVLVRLDAHGLRPGDSAFFVIHSSAGLRVYNLGPLPGAPQPLIGSERLLNQFCDTFHVLRELIELQELKWVEPPPGYHYGHEPLRQWQIVVEGLTDLEGLEILGASGEARQRIATGADFSGGGRRREIEITSDARTELWLRSANVREGARFAVAPRWLLPLHRVALRESADSLVRNGRDLELRTASGVTRFNLNTWKLSESRPVEALERGRYEPVKKRRRSLTLAGGTVAVLHDHDLVIAIPINTLTRHSAPEREATGE